jgi:tRNA (guanine-N7-)-methyltransferase
MHTTSREIKSNQSFAHPKLSAFVLRHLNSKFRRPYSEHSVSAFKHVAQRVLEENKPLIFDSFCGTGQSTAILAQKHPDCMIIGIDQSEVRLSKHRPNTRNNYLLVRADTDDFWRLAAAAGWILKYHYIFYPNPWPKSGHFKRRIHGSPLFITLLELGGCIEVRSNWQIYIEEFGMALSCTGRTAVITRIDPGQPISLFEKKYRDSNQHLWRINAKLSAEIL